MGGGVSAPSLQKKQKEGEGDDLGDGTEVDRILIGKSYSVKLLQETVPIQANLVLAHESLDFIDTSTKAVIKRYPYHSIMCWGHSNKTFQFRVFGTDTAAPSTVESETSHGLEIERILLKVVKVLMSDMKSNVVTSEEFSGLEGELERVIAGDIKAGSGASVIEIIRQFSLSRQFLARQASKVLKRVVKGQDLFEAMDVAVLLYTRMLNKESFPLMLEEFPSVEDRENVCHRLGLSIEELSRGTTAGCSPASSPSPAAPPTDNSAPDIADKNNISGGAAASR